MIELRQATEHDISQILDVRYRILDEPLGQPRAPWSVEDANLSTIHVVVADSEQIVSSLRVEQHAEYGPYVRRMATLPEYRRKGLGKQALSFAEAIASISGVSRFSLHSRIDVVEFYKNCGYVLTGRANEDETGIYPEMQKTLQ